LGDSPASEFYVPTFSPDRKCSDVCKL